MLIKKHFKLVIPILLIGVIFVGCNNNYDYEVNSTKPTLETFITSLKEQNEIDFFNTHEVIDNTSVYNLISEMAVNEYSNGTMQKVSSYALEKEKIKIKFGWGDGCKKGIGICIIIPFVYEKETNAESLIYDNKYIIFLSDDVSGITKDGYLPIFKDIVLYDNNIIKAGIYKANYDKINNRYIAITLDLKH